MSRAVGQPLEQLLATWLPDQRWFAGKGAESRPGASPRVSGTAVLTAHVRVHLVRAAGSLYQVPLTYYSAPVTGLDNALVGITSTDLGSGPQSQWVYDGPHDPVYVQALLHLLAHGGIVSSPAGPDDEGRAGVELTGRVQPAGPSIDESGPSVVLKGEQSNTSMIVSPASSPALIVKLFRVVAAGDNPDVVVQTALAAAGCTRVPQPAGWLEGSWLEESGERVGGHLAFASEFLRGSEDAWRVATRAVAGGVSFAAPAHELGEATAEVHEVLASVLPTVPASAAVLAGLADSLGRRVDLAVGQVPALAEVAQASREAVDVVRGLTGVAALQRVHGDYHLGQVMYAPGRGWVLLDFEGEPLRPLAERLEPDLALRDVAGMLRSFDYAARQTTVHLAEDDPAVAAATVWAEEARTAFLAGYSARIGWKLAEDEASLLLLRALELDKALYEVLYETRNRPDWVAIPLGAVHRLLANG